MPFAVMKMEVVDGGVRSNATLPDRFILLEDAQADAGRRAFVHDTSRYDEVLDLWICRDRGEVETRYFVVPTSTTFT